MKASPGRLMQSSVTAWSLRIGRKARKVRSSAEVSCTAGGSRAMGLSTGCNWPKLIHAPKIEVARDQHLDAIAIRLGDGGRDSDCRFQHLSSDLRGGRGVIDHRAAVTPRLHRGLHASLDDTDENRRAEAVPEVAVHLARK